MKDRKMVQDTQTAHILPLAFQFLTPQEAAPIAEHLVTLIEANGCIGMEAYRILSKSPQTQLRSSSCLRQNPLTLVRVNTGLQGSIQQVDRRETGRIGTCSRV